MGDANATDFKKSVLCRKLCAQMANLYGYDYPISNTPDAQILVLENQSLWGDPTSTELWLQGTVLGGYQATTKYGGFFNYSSEAALNDSTINEVVSYIESEPVISLFNIDIKVWQNDRAVADSGYIPELLEIIFDGNDEILGDSYADQLMGYQGRDEIYGFEGDDFIHGNFGDDTLSGGNGNDTIRGGHGPDDINGGQGSDWIWSGVGQNTISAGWSDLSRDQIFVPADRVQNTSFGNPGGANADIIKGLEASDSLYIHGVADSTLTFAATSLQGSSGIGVYSEGVLEAIVEGYGWTPAQVDAITTGGFYA